MALWQARQARLEAAKAIGRSFEQNALVWVGPEGLPKLIELR